MSTITLSKEEIRGIRDALGMSQAAFAAECGVQRTTVTHWESGIRAPSGPSLMLLMQLAARASVFAGKKILKTG